MPVDSSIALQGRLPQINDPMDVAQKGMTLKNLATQGQAQQHALDQAKMQSSLENIARLTSNVTDQASYDVALQEASQMGMDVSKLPRAYDPGLVRGYQMQAVSALDRLKMENDQKNRQNDIDERRFLANQNHQYRMEELRQKGAQAAEAKKPTADQQKAGLFATRVTSAEKIMNDLEQKGFDGADRRTWAQKYLFNEAKPVDLQKMEQAQRNFVNAVLRRESGAVISPEEFESAKQQYFPQAGDSPEVLEQKRANRLDVLAGLKAEAGDSTIQGIQAQRSQVADQFPGKKQGETVQIIDPKGVVRMIPADKVGEAIAAGGKRVQPVAGR